MFEKAVSMFDEAFTGSNPFVAFVFGLCISLFCFVLFIEAKLFQNCFLRLLSGLTHETTSKNV